MKKILFEFEDLSWFPAVIRSGGTDYLRFCLEKLKYYHPALPVLMEVLDRCQEDTLFDLCSGGGGPLRTLQKELCKQSGREIRITLSDKFPDLSAFELLHYQSDGAIGYVSEEVDAFNVLDGSKGIRTMFSALHHFTPGELGLILTNASEGRKGIAFFDASPYRLPAILAILLIHPIVFFFCTPFFRPFRFSRLLFIYLLPLIPLYTIWDGCISIFRLHKVARLKKVAEAICSNQYHCRAGMVGNSFFGPIAYIVGYPVANR